MLSYFMFIYKDKMAAADIDDLSNLQEIFLLVIIKKYSNSSKLSIQSKKDVKYYFT